MGTDKVEPVLYSAEPRSRYRPGRRIRNGPSKCHRMPTDRELELYRFERLNSPSLRPTTFAEFHPFVTG